jgi:hypothetical protein
MADFIRVGHTVHIVLTVDHSDEFMTYLNRLIRLDELREPGNPTAATTAREYAKALAAFDAANVDLINQIVPDGAAHLSDAFAECLAEIEEAEALAEMGVS